MLSEGTVVKMSAKRILICILMVMCLTGACALVYADEPLNVACAFTPADFTEPSSAKLSVTVYNASDKPIESVRIQQDANKEGETVGTVEPGETIHFSIDVPVTKKMLDAGKATFTVTYKLGTKTHKIQTSAKVTRVTNLASVTLSARMFKTAVYSGETIQAEYRLRNTGKIAVRDAVVSDQAFAFVSEAVALAPGEEKVFYALNSFTQSAISSPRVNFVSEESQNAYLVHASSVALHVTDDNLSFAIEPENVSVRYGDRAHFSVTLKNNGLLSYQNLSLTAEKLGVFQADEYLKPGETVTFHVETPPITSSQIYPIQIGMREAGGSERSFLAGEMIVSVLGIDDRNPIISVNANAEGSAPFTITVSGANRNLENVRLSEKTLGDIKTFLVIKSGAETVFSPEVHVNKGEAFEFVLTWEENGKTHTVSATPVLSRFSSKANEETDLQNVPHASLYSMVNATHLNKVVLISCFVVLMAAIVFFIAYKSVQAKKRRQQALKQLGRTSKFAPVRTRDTEKENP